MELLYLIEEFVKILLNPGVLIVLFAATALGTIIGALPGLTATMGIALLTGLTYKVPVAYTFAILMGIYVGGIYGGSISAILLNIPGTASAAATAIEGNLFAKRGKAPLAIKVTRSASIVGTLIGVLALALIAPQLSRIALQFSAVEYFLLAVFGVLMCGSIVTSDLTIKGWIGGLIGLAISFIGYDVISGAPRFDFGNINLSGGISLIPAMIGFYAIPEVIKALSLVKSGAAPALSEEAATKKLAAAKEKDPNSWLITLKHIPLILRSALIGVGIGALPGVGEDVAAWIGYDNAKKSSKHKETWGTGECYEAIIAPEVSNNAAIGGATIPLLTLAVPGSPPAAVLLGAFMIHNIRPGPMIMVDSPRFIFYIAALILAAVIALWVVGMLLAKPMSSILKIPSVYLMPIIAVLSIVGAYALNLKRFDILVVVAFGIIGYILDKMKYSAAPIVLGIILGTMIDENFRRALIVNKGDPSFFFTNSWISVVFVLIIAVVILKQLLPERIAAKANFKGLYGFIAAAVKKKG
ncbi:MAG TPA: transporter [Spirochaetaceae bacterium]|nr:transporter [Spirochaetaceae bacterium]